MDDRRGSVGQAQGIIQAIGNRLNIVEKQISYNKLACLPNWLRGRTLLGVNSQKSSDLRTGFPDLVLSISRRTVPVARYIRKHSGNKTKIVQLMYPDGGIGLKEMDMVIVPEHDSLKKQQIAKAVVILGAPTKIFPDVLALARKKWTPLFSHLPRPYTAVIIGGAIKGKDWGINNASDLAEKIKDFHTKVGGSILITTSRRTGNEAQKIIMDKLQGIPAYTYIWGEKKDNPLMGFYACSDYIITTADSVSMCSEACGTGKPVLLFLGKNWLPEKHSRFAQSLIDEGYASELNNSTTPEFHPSKILHNSEMIAERILDLIK